MELFLILQDDNIERLKEHDPSRVPIHQLPEGFSNLTVDAVSICYADKEDMKQLEALGMVGDLPSLKKALTLLSRGWKNRPEDKLPPTILSKQ